MREFIGSTGTTHALSFFVANCPYVQANGTYNIPSYVGGNFGEAAATRLTVRNGLLTGSISGRDCFGSAFTASVSMTKVPGSVLSCVRGVKAGSYSATFANSCGGTGSGSLEVVRSGCILSAVAPGLAALEATMTGPNTFNVAILPLGSCRGPSSGTGTINSDGTIVGTYSGTSLGGSGCCPAGPYSGSFALSPR